MTPSAYRAGGTDTAIRFAIGQCSLGAILVAATGTGVCAITLGDDPQVLLDELQQRFPRARLLDGTAVRLHVPRPEHVESTLWRILGDEAVNEPHS